MATKEDYEILEKITDRIREAKRNRKNIPATLCMDKEYYRKAIDSIRTSGLWTVFSSLCSMIISLTASIIVVLNTNNYLNWGEVAGYLLGIIIVTGVPAIIGDRIYRLDLTPTSILVLLIITLLFNLFLSAGILPFISLVLNIIALVRWSTYKDWFYNVK